MTPANQQKLIQSLVQNANRQRRSVEQIEASIKSLQDQQKNLQREIDSMREIERECR